MLLNHPVNSVKTRFLSKIYEKLTKKWKKANVSGKTSLAKILAGLDRFYGDVKFEDFTVNREKLKKYIFNTSNLINQMNCYSVEDYLRIYKAFNEEFILSHFKSLFILKNIILWI